MSKTPFYESMPMEPIWTNIILKSGNQMSLFVTMMCILLPLSFLLTKTLNLLLLA